jgi:hypothetical protein
MSRIDYSKWDNLQDSDDEEQQSPEPRVTRLDQPSRIVTTRGEEGFSVQPNDPPRSRPTRTAATNKIPTAWTEKGGRVELEDTDGVVLYWTQDRYSVTLRVPAPEGPLEVQVTGMLNYVDRNCATAASSPKLIVRCGKEAIWWQGDLPHPVHLTQDSDDDVDWSVERINQQRYLIIILYKAVPMEGVFLWWKRPLLQCPETSWKNEGNSNSLQQAWNEAHTHFQENIANREPKEI